MGWIYLLLPFLRNKDLMETAMANITAINCNNGRNGVMNDVATPTHTNINSPISFLIVMIQMDLVVLLQILLVALILALMIRQI